MYYPIHIKLNLSEDTVNINEAVDTFFTEAVFSNGKETVEPLLEIIQKIKDELDARVKEQEDSTSANKNDKKVKIKPFNPKEFWKNTLFKDLEDKLRDIFGFRNVEIHPYIERYITAQKKFESCELNCAVYHVDRFPVEGLVTEKGFYDKSHSLTMEIYITLGLLQKLTAEEVLAVLLHEFGHSIDPALTDIKYTQTNILSKYITDRKGAINKDEKRIMKKFESFGVIFIFSLLYLALIFAGPIMELFQTKEGLAKKRLKKLKEKLESDKERFNRQNYSEAFADNFARMYGYGHVLMKALKKMSNNMDRELRSRFKKEKERQRVIYNITLSMLGDVHKTDIHRIRNLIQEYKKDINDPATPAVVKKQLEEDLVELEKVLDQYLNHKDEFQKRVNNLINEELKKLEDEDEKKEAAKKAKEETSKKDEPKEDKESDKDSDDKNDK